MPTRAALVSALCPALVLLALSAGCATPSPIIRLHPRDPDVFWAAGREVVSHADTGVRVAVAFDHQRPDMLGLRVEIANDTDTRVDVAPSDVTYATCASDAAGSCAPAQLVLDPEAALNTLEVQHSQQMAQAENDATASAALMLLGVAADVHAISRGHPEHAQNTAVAADAASFTTARDASVLGSIEGDQVRWASAFRRTTLFPGQGVGGPVYIPIVPDARVVWLQVRVGARKFLFCFSQEVREVLPERTDTSDQPGSLRPREQGGRSFPLM